MHIMTLAKRTRILYLLLSICSLICLICIGFSSWTIVSEVTKTAGGSLIASPVVDHSEYVTCESVDCFEFSEEGFAGSNLDIGYVKVEYTLNAETLAKLDNSADDYTITFYLRAIDVNGSQVDFYNDEKTSATMQVLGVGSSSTQTQIINGTTSLTNPFTGTISYQNDSTYHCITLKLSEIDVDNPIVINYAITYSGEIDNERINYSKLYEILYKAATDTAPEKTAQFYCHGRVEKAS